MEFCVPFYEQLPPLRCSAPQIPATPQLSWTLIFAFLAQWNSCTLLGFQLIVLWLGNHREKQREGNSGLCCEYLICQISLDFTDYCPVPEKSCCVYFLNYMVVYRGRASFVLFHQSQKQKIPLFIKSWNLKIFDSFLIFKLSPKIKSFPPPSWILFISIQSLLQSLPSSWDHFPKPL